MKTFLSGFLLGLVVLPTAAYLYIRSGYAPVAVAAPPFPLEKRLARMALHARISKEAPAQSPVPASEPNLLAGAKLYLEHCAVCHGSVGKPETATAKGMFPHPPKLMEGKGVTDDPVGEIFWKASNGIRLTGMPSYRGALTDEQLWQVSQTLLNADKLPESARQSLVAPTPAK